MRKRNKLGLWLLPGALTLTILASTCSTSSDLGSMDQVEIYTTVIERIYTADDTFGGNLHPSTIYILDHSDDSVGDPEAEQGPSTLFSEPMRREIESALAFIPAQIIWVADQAVIPLDPETHSVAAGGAFLSLGNLHQKANNAVHVSASLYIGMLAAGGQTYIVEKINGVWSITGTTGLMWIS